MVPFSCDLRAKVIQDGMKECDEGSLNRSLNGYMQESQHQDTEGRTEREEPHCHVLSLRAAHCLI